MYKFLDERAIKLINKFLTTPLPNKRFFGDISYNIERIIDSNEPIDDLVKQKVLFSILDKLPKYDVENNFRSIRDSNSFKLDEFIVYNDLANTFKSFRLTNYNGTLNDKKETQWFSQYIKFSIGYVPKDVQSGIDWANNLRRSGCVLAKYTTTTFNNDQYMISNYSRLERKYVAYCAEQVLDEFDSLVNYQGLLPIRGFVRYDSTGKGESINLLKDLSAKLMHKMPDVFKVASLILSYFVKGECMSIEGEFRFILINTKPWDDNFDIEADNRWGRISKPVCLENPFYRGCDKFCNLPAEQCEITMCMP